uniref:Indole-3-glycerol-phosphate synthase n=1 Tax=Ascaris lumbricoides TaxID=6252 RepID=A0A0M3IGU8_ASCLU
MSVLHKTILSELTYFNNEIVEAAANGQLQVCLLVSGMVKRIEIFRHLKLAGVITIEPRFFVKVIDRTNLCIISFHYLYQVRLAYIFKFFAVKKN